MTDYSPPTAAGATSGVIEFICQNCQKQLRVAAADAGRRIKCPACAHVMQIPEELRPTAGDGPLPGYGTPPGAAVSSPAAGNSDGNHHFASPSTPPLRPSPPEARLQPTEVPAVAVQQTAQQPVQQPPSEQVLAIRAKFDAIVNEIRKIYVGQDELVLGTLVALFSGGHVLIESVPGLGKTLFVRTLGQVLGCKFGRIQFTADLMPSDITGAPIFDMKNQEFRFRPGPVFTQLLLADEINRSPAKTHAALLEIMQEYRVTIDSVSHKIERPFLVMATQNPIESEGTYNLPEAQLDRFMFKIVANYPGEAEEADILRMHGRQVDLGKRLEEDVQTVCSRAEILEITEHCNQILIDERLIDYINKLVRLTREWPQFHIGASPRAGIALMQGARTMAAFRGRDYAVPDDVIEIALQALRHRVSLTAEAEVEGHRVDDLLRDLIRSVEVPRL